MKLGNRRLLTSIAVVVALSALTGCSVATADSSASHPKPASPDATPTPAAKCVPGAHAEGTQYTVFAAAAKTNVDFTAGACFDLQTTTLGTAGSSLQDLQSLCDSIGLEPELNKYLSHGIKQLTPLGFFGVQSATPGGLCAYQYSIDDLAKVPDWQTAGTAEVVFQFEADADGSGYARTAYGLAATPQKLSGVGIAAATWDSAATSHIYILTAESKAGVAVKIFTLFPTSLLGKQQAVDAELPTWAKKALALASTSPFLSASTAPSMASDFLATCPQMATGPDLVTDIPLLDPSVISLLQTDLTTGDCGRLQMDFDGYAPSN